MKNGLGKYISKLVEKYKTDNNCKKVDIYNKLKITNQHLNDIENGNRTPSAELIHKMIILFNLSKEEQIKLYDLVSESHTEKKVPADIEEFIVKNKDAKNKIRNLMDEYTFNAK